MSPRESTRGTVKGQQDQEGNKSLSSLVGQRNDFALAMRCEGMEGF